MHKSIILNIGTYPDAIHHPNFPSPVCRAGEVWHTTTVYRFTRESNE